jgi:hypothetical protein
MAVDLKPYDFPQVLRSVFEVEDNCLRVKVIGNSGGGGPELEVAIDHTEDSIRLGDGRNFFTSSQVDSKNGLDVNVINNPLQVNVSNEVEVTNDAGNPLPIIGTVTANLGTIADVATETTLSSINSNIIKSDTDNVTIISSSLPSGASTSALQTTANSSLSSIDSKLTSPLTVQSVDLDIRNLVFATDKADVSGSSLLITNFPSTQTVDGTVELGPNSLAALENITVNVSSEVEIKNDSGNPVPVNGSVSISGTANVNITNSSLAVTGPLTDTELRASAVPISAATLPLPSGATTSANQVTANASLSSIDSKLTSPLTVQSTNLDIRDLVFTTDKVDISGSSVAITGSVSVTGPLTDVQLRASAVPVSLASVPTHAVTQSGNWSTRTQDGAGNNLTSQVNGSQQALDVGINVAGVQIDPRSPLPVTFTHTSFTATAASQVALASNSTRKYLLIQNNSAQNIWIRLGTAATAAAPSLLLTNGSTFVLENNIISTQSINVIRGGAANATFTIIEGA